MKIRGLLFGVMLAVFTTAASAQSNWVGQFLNRYKPPKTDPAAAALAQASDEPWRVMVQQGLLPISVSDIIRLMLGSNLDVAVNRFSPLTNQYLLQTLFRPFEPTLDISAQMLHSTTPSSSQLQGGGSLTSLSHRYSIGYGQTLHTGT